MCVLLGSCVPVHVVFSGVLWVSFVSVVFVCTCCVFVSVVFSGVYLYLSCSLGFVTVVFSGVYLYLSCSRGFVSVVFSGVCNCCVLWGLLYLSCSLGFVTVVFSGVYLYLSCSLGFVTVVSSEVYLYLSCCRNVSWVFLHGCALYRYMYEHPDTYLTYNTLIIPIELEVSQTPLFKIGHAAF